MNLPGNAEVYSLLSIVRTAVSTPIALYDYQNTTECRNNDEPLDTKSLATRSTVGAVNHGTVHLSYIDKLSDVKKTAMPSRFGTAPKPIVKETFNATSSPALPRQNIIQNRLYLALAPPNAPLTETGSRCVRQMLIIAHASRSGGHRK